MKDFLVIGSLNAVTYKQVFPLIKEGKVGLGANHPKVFVMPDDTLKKFGNVCWYTTLYHGHVNPPLVLTKRYTPEAYPKYDNYDAIEVGRAENIPMDYDGVMGVPISFLDKYCPEQFEIVGLDRYVEDNPHYGKRFDLLGKETFARILIHRRK